MGYYKDLYTKTEEAKQVLGYPDRIGRDYEQYVYVVTETVCLEPGNFSTVNISAYTKESDAQAQRNYLERYSELEGAFYSVEQLDLNP